jgi:hypothetical protein
VADIEQPTSRVAAAGERSVAIGGNASGPIVTGDGNTILIAAEGVGRRAVSLPPRRRLAGREELLIGLREAFPGPTSAERTGPDVLVLHGLGGVGKSSVALEYAHRHWATGDYSLVWWVKAAEPATIGPQLGILLGAQLEVPDLQQTDPVATTKAVLAARTEPWLLIFDNADSLAAIRDFLPPAGRGHVLITSRNPNWHPYAGLAVPDLAPSAAAEFLTARSGDPDPATAAELARQLGSLPLALEQAGAYIAAAPGATLASYLASYRQRRTSLHQRGNPADYDDHVATTWSLALEALSPVAAGLLRLMACFAPDDIPLSRLLTADVALEGLAPEPARVLGQLTANDLELDAALADLYRFSLVRTGAGPSAGGQAHGIEERREGRLVSVHRLVQSVVLDQLSEEQRSGWAQAARRLLERALPAEPDDPLAWPTLRALLPHVLAGDYRSARLMEEEVVRARLRVSGAEHPDTLTAQGNLALTLADLGLWEQARGLQEEVVRARLRVSGAEHPDTLTAQGNLANTLANLGLLHDARRVEEQVVRARLRALGPEHPDTVRAQGNLAGTLYALGKWDQARRLQEQVVRARLLVLGPEHPATLRAQGNLALTLYSSGKLAEARRLQEQVVRARLRVSGAHHPDTVRAQTNLASTLAGLGKVVEARRLQEKVVRAQLEADAAERLDVVHAEGLVAQRES